MEVFHNVGFWNSMNWGVWLASGADCAAIGVVILSVKPLHCSGTSVTIDKEDSFRRRGGVRLLYGGGEG